MSESKVEADKLLIPDGGLENVESVATLAHRSAIAARAADQRARQALELAKTTHERCWTKEQHRSYADRLQAEWARMQRRFYVLLVTTTLAVGLVLFISWRVLTAGTDSNARINSEIMELAQVTKASCETRNTQLEQQRVTLEELAIVVQSLPDAAAQGRAIAEARRNLPTPFDCSLYGP